MSLNYYRLYIKDVLDLSKTMVIKVESVAEAINKQVSTIYKTPVDPDDKKTWKYYLNLSGQYHSTDKKIYVTSLDTLENIEFNRTNLEIHRATKHAYQYGSRFYRELLTLYPEHESFILGCLYPVDIDKAIEANDFTVIGYPKHLIEEGEVSLVNKINNWLANFKERWYNKQFNLTDTNYLAAFLGVLYLQLPALIITLRLRACKTNEAHSFHIREYLKSHGLLDRYLSNMTKKQALFFYRNINYIERNSGKKEVFDWLMEKVLTDRSIPLSEFNMNHNTENIEQDLLPKANFKKRLLNEKTKVYDHDLGFYDLAYILSREEPDAVGNIVFRSSNENNIKRKFEHSKKNFYKTKVLESSMYDYTDSTPITLQDIVLNNWIYLSQKGKLPAVVNIDNPTNGASIPVSSKVAFLVFLHAYNKAHGFKVDKVPSMVATRVPIEPVPTKEDLLKVVDTKYVPEEYIDYAISLHYPYKPMVSVLDFKEWSQKHYEQSLKQLYFISNHEHYYTRGLVHNAVSRLYQLAYVDNEYTNRNFEDILRENNVNLEGIRDTDWIKLYKDIYTKGTGHSMDATFNAAELQKAMISLMKQLSSYSIQFLQSINQSSIKSINWAALRLGDISFSSKILIQIQIAIIKILKLQIKNNPLFKVNLKDLLLRFNIKPYLNLGLIELPLNILSPAKINVTKIVNLGDLYLNNDYRLTCFDKKIQELPLFKSYYDLSDEEKAKIKDIYTNYPTEDDYIPNVDITNIVKDHRTRIEAVDPKINILDSFKHLYVNTHYDAFYSNDTVLVLDGFYNNLLSNNINQFNIFKGFYKIPSFKYVSQVKPVSEFKTKIYTGGIYKGNMLSLRMSGDIELNLNGLVSIHDKVNMDIKDSLSMYSFDNKYFNWHEFKLNFKYLDDTTKFNFKVTLDEVKLNEIKDANTFVKFSLQDQSSVIVIKGKQSIYSSLGNLTFFNQTVTINDVMKPVFILHRLRNSIDIVTSIKLESKNSLTNQKLNITLNVDTIKFSLSGSFPGG